ncbi:hypothetical protein ARMSODRAFT_1089444 [Armillaria solidipes]|uniref:Uncharacterized protein n=1 Tax=Armillaria solidipes TaxID=1076256 RepID=A0A2H3AT79_9AGAR|nr:hypothetical protein ARMSODRAFT_1089444 [Armillaria solidipes]
MASCPSLPIPSVCSSHSCPDIPKSISDDPRIQVLLKCNDPPLEAERLSLLTTESSSLTLLSVLKEKVDNVQQMLKTLLDGQAKVMGNLLAAKALLHPIRSIPDDVLSYVFSFCVHEVNDLLKQDVVLDSFDSRKPPWTLSQVCRSWRRVTLSVASLWRCISLNFQHYRELGHVHVHPFMLGLYVQRARHHQLTIRLSSTKDISSHVFIPVLLSSMPHWKHLCARIPAKSLEVFSTYRGYLESLHYLDLRQPRQDQAKSPIHTFEMAQNLRVLSIGSTLCRHIYLPDGGKALTELLIRGPFVKHIFSFLRKMPNIEKLYLYFENSKPFERLSTPITMPKLVTLLIAEWNGAAPSSIAHLFESLELPALSDLYFNLDDQETDSTVLLFPEILPHHHCHEINGLTVTAPESEIGKTGLIKVLTHIINMQHLTVSAKIVDEELLSALTRSGNNDDILPRLRTFDLRESDTIPNSKILLEMVARMKGQTGNGEQEEGVIELKMLEEVYLGEPLTFDDPSLASRWQSLQSNGLVVYDGN